MNAFLDNTVAQLLGKKVKEGLVGVEVEVEASIRPLPTTVNEYWNVTNDGSLRGEAKEYVFVAPLEEADALIQTKTLYKKLEGNIADSMRAGVHVHINCLNLTGQQLFTFMAAYYCLEDLLTEDLGEERQGNLFCLRLSDADYANTAIMAALQAKDFRDAAGAFTNENLRYAAMNLVSLKKFGSLEFRAMRTPTTVEPLQDWIRILCALQRNSTTKYSDPSKLLNAMSANGGANVVRELLGPFAEKQIKKPNFESKLYEGIRNIQQWVFLNSWEK